MNKSEAEQMLFHLSVVMRSWTWALNCPSTLTVTCEVGRGKSHQTKKLFKNRHMRKIE